MKHLENQCNEKDEKIYKTKNYAVTDALTSCGAGITCTGECAATCIKKKVDVSGGCASCLGGISKCRLANCKYACFLSTTSRSCKKCEKDNCSKGFKKCSGLSSDYVFPNDA